MHRLGRRPARHTGQSRRSKVVMGAHLGGLGAAPAQTNDYIAKVTVPWRMMLNDQVGDCCCAGQGHEMMLRTANVGQIVIPTAYQVLRLYEAVGGYIPGDAATDQGCDMLTMEEYLKSTGFIGHKIDAYGGVDHANQNYLIWAVQLFGTCGIGVNLPAWAETAFDAGEPWGDPPEGADTSIVGGHYFPLVDYRNGWFKCVTWGAIQPVNMDFLKRYADEAFAAADFDWIAAVGVAPSGFDLAQLAADLASIA